MLLCIYGAGCAVWTMVEIDASLEAVNDTQH